MSKVGPAFEELAQKIDAYAERTNTNRPGKIERWSLGIALFATGFGMMAGSIIRSAARLTAINVSLLVELLGFAVFAVFLVRREWKSFARAHQSFAKELDGDYAIFREYVSWLGEFSNAEIGRRLRYIRDRKDVMSYKPA